MPGDKVNTEEVEEGRILCPLVNMPKVPVCDPSEFDDLVAFLNKNEGPLSDMRFTRGSISTDGRLDLCKQGLGVPGTGRLVSALRKNQFIKHVLLGTDSLGNSGTKILASHIGAAENIETLYLGCNLIGEQGAKFLAEALSQDALSSDVLGQDSKVKSLWLKRNPIGDKGALWLSKMLENNSTLRTLDLVNTNIGKKGLASIASVLESGKKPLQAIYLGGNQLDQTCFDSLIRILHTPNIKALFLNVNFLGDEFIEALCANAPYGNKLLNLGLASNGLGITGLKKLLSSSENIKFRSLDLGYSRSTKALNAKGNFFGDTLGDSWRQWVYEQDQLEELMLNKTGVGHNSLCSMISAIEHHSSLNVLKLSRVRNAVLRARLRKALSKRNDKADTFNDFRDDLKKIISIYR